MAERFKEHIMTHLATFSTDTFGKNTTDRKSNSGKVLSEIYLWQEVLKHAAEKYKDAWKRAQTNGGLIPSDDDLRALGKGDHIVVESEAMSCVVKISEERMTLDPAEFMTTIAKRFKIPLTKLEAIAEKSRKKGAASLSKRILEASNA